MALAHEYFVETNGFGDEALFIRTADPDRPLEFISKFGFSASFFPTSLRNDTVKRTAIVNEAWSAFVTALCGAPVGEAGATW